VTGTETLHQLAGTWYHVSGWDSDDWMSKYEVAVDGDAVRVRAYDAADGEEYVVSDILWDGEWLRFHSLMRSTGREGLNELRPLPSGEVESRFTFTFTETLVPPEPAPAPGTPDATPGWPPPRMADLLEIMRRLRDPQSGCPWDIEQTFATIAPYTIEEAYEVADAIDRNDLAHLKDELGDLLLQVVFHARMAEEGGHFDFGDVVAAICDKMIRRHPHVFDAHGRANAAGGRMPGAAADARVESAAAQTLAWEEHKKREREAAAADGTPPSALDGVARGLPEWQRSVKLQKRAASLGFDWPHVDDVFAKLHEEIDECRAEFAALREAPDAARARDRLEDELGDLLFVAANLTRHGGVDFGGALRRANAKFERRFRRMEALARAAGTPLESLDLAQQDALWNVAKAEERQPT
jgi:ATP diphosphatase